jgi:hypothetical protein
MGRRPRPAGGSWRFLRGAVPAAFLGSAALCLAAPAQAADVNLNVTPGAYRALDQTFWDPVDHQYGFGAMADFGPHHSHAHFAVGFSSSAGTSSSGDFAGSVNELSLGFTWAWQTEGRMRGYLGGGPSFVNARYEIDTPIAPHVDDNDDSYGLWLEAGVAWRMGDHFSLGFSGRALTYTSVTLFGVDGNANYWQLGPSLGWSWPRWKR